MFDSYNQGKRYASGFNNHRVSIDQLDEKLLQPIVFTQSLTDE